MDFCWRGSRSEMQPGAPAAQGPSIPVFSPSYQSSSQRPLALVLLGLSIFLQACPGPVVEAPVVQSASAVLYVLGTQPSVGSGVVSASDPQGLPLTYRISRYPSVGTVSINASTGAFTYTVAGNTTASSDSFIVAASNGTATDTGTISIQLYGDPLLANQWHIQNKGVTAFSSTLPVPGNDMNVAGAWAAGYSGEGIKVAVVDTGLEIAHEDLSANVDVANSYNFLTRTHDPTPSPSDLAHDHGTQVAGIIGAVAFNGKGGRGVAFGARLRGYNYLRVFPNMAAYADSMGGTALSADNDIFSESFSNTERQDLLQPVDTTETSIQGNLHNLRGGRGAILVNAAGNNFSTLNGITTAKCNEAKTYGVGCFAPAADTRLDGITPIVVGAFNARGVKSSYSSAGSELWVSAPGGEYGGDSRYVSGGDANTYQPAIVTTARTGCQYQEAPYNALNAGDSPFAMSCQYTATMNGTSSATPNTSGVVALMLEANPNLSWRDVKDILAKTARKIDPGYSGVTTTEMVPGAAVTLDQGWVRNAAGYWFSNWYGFGAVDATAAVNMAESYSSFLPPFQIVSYTYAFPGNVVPPESTSGFSMYVPVSEPFATVEEIIVFLNIDTTPSLQCNQVEVTSPSGTKSIVLHAANGFTQPSVTDARLLSNAFYGEPVNGTWTISYYDFCPASYGSTILLSSEPHLLFAVIGH
jgi:subtilisin family serine protease